MNYLIVFINKDGWEWCLMESYDRDYISKVFEDIAPPPEYNMELRETNEDVDVYISFNVLKYDRSNF